MQENEQYIRDLIQSSFQSATVKNITPFTGIFSDANLWTDSPKYLYYGVVNIGNGGSFAPKLQGSEITLSDTALTQPILFQFATGNKFSFIGYRVEIESNIQSLYSFASIDIPFITIISESLDEFIDIPSNNCKLSTRCSFSYFI